jgi:hypothetical protein
MKKAKRKENWMFNVPNDEEGAYFTHLFNKYLNKDSYEVRRRPRGKRAVHAKKDTGYARAYDAYLPVRHATRLQVYVTKKTTDSKGNAIDDRSGRTGEEFLNDTFKYHKICDECGQGQVGHSAIFIPSPSGYEFFRVWQAVCADGSTYRPSFS